MTLADVIREQSRGRDYLELLTPDGVAVAGFYIAEGEEVGAGEIVEDARVDFKAFLSEPGGVQVRHLGGLLVDGLIRGRYSDEAGITFSEQFGLAADQVAQLVSWLERKEGGSETLVVSAGPRLRLSSLAV